MKSWSKDGSAAALDVAAAPASPLTHLERALDQPAPIRLAAALRRHAHQIDCQADRVVDGTVHDLLTADRTAVERHIDQLEASA